LTVEARLDALDRELLDRFQRGFSLTPRPYAAIGERLGVSEAEVLARLSRLQAERLVSRVGAVVRPHAAGHSTLAAMAVPADRLEDVAAQVSAFAEVNHNYEREHELNLWFVVAAANSAHVAEVLDQIRATTGLDVLDLPLEEPYRLDLGFPLSWT
jgi:DNA-binding Lrp family transcriptional regulator